MNSEKFRYLVVIRTSIFFVGVLSDLVNEKRLGYHYRFDEENHCIGLQDEEHECSI